MSASFSSRTIEALSGLVFPWVFLNLSASFIPGTIKDIFSTHGFVPGLRIVLSPSRFREVWFGRFWAYVSPNIRMNAGPLVLPLLDGRVSRGRVVEEPTGPGVGGVVLEIGPGSGLWVNLFSDRCLYEEDTSDAAAQKQQGGNTSLQKRANTARSKVTRVYGVEPNASHHAALRRSIEAAGLKDIYEIVPVGIEDLSSSSDTGRKKWEGSIEPESVDCIVSVICLCSIPDPERNIHELYKLLRPGGRWYIYEHVKCDYSWYMRLYQRGINLIWPYLIGGCELCRPTDTTLRETGPWASIDVGQPPIDNPGRTPFIPWYQCLPHRIGVFTK
ncbi:hypothetical protein E0Z10_g7302 [Xylaria hypoxylon]|uniref:Methyltransferase type 11 domain-containing protein n=1 Tax=Xylaria hypoxylon TaxID=37992 RepID=A0A4Z0YPU5_9PEZI|nr:hypothetical protein E0Z10_g7302 [Xylaria hypoxylon]